MNRLQMPRWGQGLRRQLWWALLGRTHVCDTCDLARKFRSAMVRETGECAPIVCLDGCRIDQVWGTAVCAGCRCREPGVACRVRVTAHPPPPPHCPAAASLPRRRLTVS